MNVAARHVQPRKDFLYFKLGRCPRLHWAWICDCVFGRVQSSRHENDLRLDHHHHHERRSGKKGSEGPCCLVAAINTYYDYPISLQHGHDVRPFHFERHHTRSMQDSREHKKHMK